MQTLALINEVAVLVGNLRKRGQHRKGKSGWGYRKGGTITNHKTIPQRLKNILELALQARTITHVYQPKELKASADLI